MNYNENNLFTLYAQYRGKIHKLCIEMFSPQPMPESSAIVFYLKKYDKEKNSIDVIEGNVLNEF